MGSLAAYWRFQDAVAQAQLEAWLPATGHLLIDISGPSAHTARLAAMAGHTVLRVLPRSPYPVGIVDAGGVDANDSDRAGRVDRGGGRGDQQPQGYKGYSGPNGQGERIRQVIADLPSLSFLADGSADGVIAEGRTLSLTLAAESLISEISRVLRPSGQVLACVDSLVFGMAVLAEHQHWPELADLPRAEVVLVPWPDGTITRCYGTEQLRELFADGGLEISWIRPRTVLAAHTVSYLLSATHTSMDRLVETELRAKSDDSVGTQLVVCARKPQLKRHERRPTRQVDHGEWVVDPTLVWSTTHSP
jgi:hypothetical protein